MQAIIKLVVDNGVAVAWFFAFIYFIFVDKKETLSVDNFTVKLDEHVAAPGEPK